LRSWLLAVVARRRRRRRRLLRLMGFIVIPDTPPNPLS
jgi:hypothetical protein